MYSLQVEVLVMEALSKGLVKGTINQIDQIVIFTWVQPRVLDTDQLKDMHTRLGEWLGKVGGVYTCDYYTWGYILFVWFAQTDSPDFSQECNGRFTSLYMMLRFDEFY